MSADFFSFALPLDDESARELLPMLAGAEQTYKDNVYVEATDEVMGLAEDESMPAMSSSYPAFVMLDRLCAGRLTGGRAHRWFAATELAALRELVATLGGEDGVDTLARGLAQAESTKRGLLLVCVPC